MRNFRTVDLLEKVIVNQTKELGSSYRELDFNKKSIEKECELIDMFIDETEAIGFEVDVQENTLNIVISVITPCFQYVGTANTFMEIASKTVEIRFESYDDDNIKVSFVFEGIWDRCVA